MTSRARRPRRASSNRTARSRRPIAVVRSQLSVARCACSAEMVLGTAGVHAQLATASRAATSSGTTSPRNWASRRSERRPLMTHFTVGDVRQLVCRCTNPMTSTAPTVLRPLAPRLKRSTRNCRAIVLWRSIAGSATPCWRCRWCPKLAARSSVGVVATRAAEHTPSSRKSRSRWNNSRRSCCRVATQTGRRTRRRRAWYWVR